MHFDDYIKLWQLIPDGLPIITHSSRLLPVLQAGQPAMLKIPTAPEEQAGALLMQWYNGNGAAGVLAYDPSNGALLLEKATGTQSLATMARNGQDHQATQLLCKAVQHLHTPRPTPPPALTPLTTWFRDLELHADKYGGILLSSLTTARHLLSHPQETIILHGDIHHDNILDFGHQGWLAIDPKGLSGERYFDYANIFCNPDLTTAKAHFHERLTTITATAQLDRQRLLQWILAWSGLSAIWTLQDGDQPDIALNTAAMAASAL
ncbi:hypothetical protein F0L74_27525 [Chitinophaga agrisoli]|uniref:Streptomycin 6-kinase n=1 Tax=Chitinophaga agrisoli TaxID=2607653 RepID=A0A5B2VP19_9BACT|nr:aminoglycoside phosphotransferase family protein [Chitinophaga agrisoli]KAA2239937.1 hypothetical protein F0L74_27525 [Chitinophaga agrisoli]